MCELGATTVSVWRCALCAAALALASGAARAELADPTRPPTPSTSQPTQAKPAVHWELTSTLISPGRRIAVINGRACRRGEHIDGARVVTIEPGRVRLRHDGRNLTLRLGTEGVKQSATIKEAMKSP